MASNTRSYVRCSKQKQLVVPPSLELYRSRLTIHLGYLTKWCPVYGTCTCRHCGKLAEVPWEVSDSFFLPILLVGSVLDGTIFHTIQNGTASEIQEKQATIRERPHGYVKFGNCCPNLFTWSKWFPSFASPLLRHCSRFIEHFFNSFLEKGSTLFRVCLMNWLNFGEKIITLFSG